MTGRQQSIAHQVLVAVLAALHGVGRLALLVGTLVLRSGLVRLLVVAVVVLVLWRRLRRRAAHRSRR